MLKRSSNPLVSAVIPTHNRLSMLIEAVESVLSQTYRPIELLVIDDGSTDGTREALENIRGLRYLNTGECAAAGAETDEPAEFFPGIRSASPFPPGARGVSRARNLGIRHARGEFIAFLDSDDLWKPEKIERQIYFFSEHPELWIAQSEEIWIRSGRRVNPKRIHKKYGGRIFTHCLPRCAISPSAVIMRKALFDLVGPFNETYPVCEDYELWLRVASRFPVGLLEEPLTIKRGGHADQLSRGHSLDAFRIHALRRIMRSEALSAVERHAAGAELSRKAEIYSRGLRKRGRFAESDAVLGMSQKT